VQIRSVFGAEAECRQHGLWNGHRTLSDRTMSKQEIARGSAAERYGILYGNLERTISCYDCRANQPVYCCCSDAKFGRDLALALSLTALALHGY
jgi:hypothetical protein